MTYGDMAQYDSIRFCECERILGPQVDVDLDFGLELTSFASCPTDAYASRLRRFLSACRLAQAKTSQTCNLPLSALTIYHFKLYLTAWPKAARTALIVPI